MGEQEVYVPIMCPKDSHVIQENWHILVRQKFQFFWLLANEKEEKIASNAKIVH